MKKTWIYVAGPYTKGDVVVNVREATLVGIELRKRGFVPVIPHLSMMDHLVSPQSYEFWMQWDSDLLERCDVLVRLFGESDGSRREVEFARKLGLRVIDFSFSWPADVIAKEVAMELESEPLTAPVTPLGYDSR